MTDLATLGIRVESQEVAVADQRLDDLTASSVAATGATNKLAAAARGQGAAQMVANTAMVQQQRTLTAIRGSMGLTAQEGLNMSRQFVDIGVTAAMGMNPLMIAIQQGPQLFDVFQMAAIRAGTSIRAAMVATGIAVWTALAPLLPIIAGLAVAAGAIAIAWNAATRTLRKDIGDVTDGMKLTEEQMKRLKEQGVETSITAGDAFRSYGTTIKEVLQEAFGPQLEWAGNQWSSFLSGAEAFVLKAVKVIGAGFLGTYYSIITTWKMMPAALGDAATAAANAVLRAMEFMVNRGADGINTLIRAAKGLSVINPAFLPARALSEVGRVSFGQMDRPNAGAMQAMDAANAANYGRAYRQIGAGIDAFQSRWAANARASAEARVRGAAGDGAGGEAGSSGAERQARAVREELTRIENIDLLPLRGAIVELVDPLKLIADEMRLIDDLARDTARGLASAFGESGRALGDLLTTMSGYQSRLAEIDLAEREYRLNAIQAERERANAQIGHYGDMASAARGFFEEGSDGYRALLAVEQVYRAFQLAGMIQSMALGGQETAMSVANSMAKGAASAAAGAAKMFEMLGPFAFPIVAGMLGLLAGLGLGSRGGGSGSPSMPSGQGDTPDASTAAVRALGARDSAARDLATSAIASKVEVRVTADRDGLNAYVVRTAKREAVGVAMPMVAAAAAGTKRDVMQTLQGQREGNRRAPA